MKIYINGMQDTSTTAFEGLITTSFIPVGIGRNGGDGWSEYFDGIIDEAAIYNRALTPEEIQQHYQHGLRGLGYCAGPPVGTPAISPLGLVILTGLLGLVGVGMRRRKV